MLKHRSPTGSILLAEVCAVRFFGLRPQNDGSMVGAIKMMKSFHKREPYGPSGPRALRVQVFCRRQNLEPGRIHFSRVGVIKKMK